ncbi:MAG: hypothetical protein NUW37_02955 [Planctomycetes bacterium]|nr:hypothetical protein [Planctomycetota bacterium]
MPSYLKVGKLRDPYIGACLSILVLPLFIWLAKMNSDLNEAMPWEPKGNFWGNFFLIVLTGGLWLFFILPVIYAKRIRRLEDELGMVSNHLAFPVFLMGLTVVLQPVVWFILQDRLNRIFSRIRHEVTIENSTTGEVCCPMS